jgi:hypothetical protein
MKAVTPRRFLGALKGWFEYGSKAAKGQANRAEKTKEKTAGQ